MAENDDLLAGAVPDLQKQQDNTGIEEHEHRLNLQRSLFNSALLFAFLLYMAGIGMGVYLLILLGSNPNIHWHAAILVAAFIAPPTIIILALVRGLFQEKKDKNNEADSTGVLTADMTKEIMKKGVDMVLKAVDTNTKTPHNTP